MKKKLLSFMPFIIMALCATSFTSCSDDDESGDSNPLAGTWEEVFKYETTTTTTTFVFQSNGSGVKTVRIDVDGTPGLTQDPLSFSYTYNAETEVFRIKYDDSSILYTGTASITGNTLVLRYDDTYYSLKKK